MKSIASSVTVIVAIAAALTLTGCADAVGAAPVVTPSQSVSTAAGPTATPLTSAPPTPASLDQLHQEYTASGLSCEWVVTENVMSGTIASGRCTDSENGISTFATQADVDALLKLNSDSIEPGLFLVGTRWVVGSEHPQDLVKAQTTMGGDLWPTDSAFFVDQ
ncbi:MULTISPECIES: hypothetical protein [Cryobacterium]|uniref:Uncharacterized protein n=1 Tax=Cryobacterium breve TaxID=1259258 RepID=A0ABY2IYA6_9MICO|nr:MULTISPECIES: hypothetical protein [Cryobacterium]TFC96806.1 hypothetical protein E3T20_02050 [Cryobacterium sp. TmT3-12]TFC97398.1 hypothetical protein E3O65_11455 [Cryobacterium breve]